MTAILQSPPPAFTPEEAAEVMRSEFGLSGQAEPLVSERDQNFRFGAEDGTCYLLKIANAAESPEAIAFENEAMDHLATVAPSIPVPRLLRTRTGATETTIEDRAGRQHRVRVLSWLPGTILRKVTLTPALRRELGAALAALDRGLRGFFHPAACKPLLWDMTRLGELEEKLSYIQDNELQTLCREFIDRFNQHISPALKVLRAQVIYNDLNPSNVLVSEADDPTLTGIVDFGDMIHGPLVCDLAVAAAYQLADNEDPLAPAIEFAAAYHRVNPLEPEELDLVAELIIARLVTTICITSWRAGVYPERRDYILRNAGQAARALPRLMAIDRRQAADRFRRACPPVPVAAACGAPEGDTDSLLEKRTRTLGSAYRLFYDRPLHIVRGEGVWLYDARGRAYLDAYNNVPLVGHSHPGVVQALTSQAATLNTHTRYLHQGVLEYAERLLGMFPPGLDRVMFGCTGSEANELALRIARAVTGNRGVIVSSFAYHGNTTAIAQLSPSYMSAEPREDWVEVISPPDAYRAGTSADETRTSFMEELDRAIRRLADRGIQPAALLLDPGFTSDGMYPPPPASLAEAARRVRAAGGLYIGDEVQAGFGRFGTSTWGFQRDDFVPDIVTLGKPMGNGHPLAATVTGADILAEFAKKTRYFNTFGGNPVSAAVGMAVLDAYEADELEHNSAQNGAYMHGRLRELAGRHELIGDIRGSGLFAGVELVLDRNTREPATHVTATVVNRMRDQGVLISSIGPRGNVLKIRPPLPFKAVHVDQLIDTLDSVLSGVHGD